VSWSVFRDTLARTPLEEWESALSDEQADRHKGIKLKNVHPLIYLACIEGGDRINADTLERVMYTWNLKIFQDHLEMKEVLASMQDASLRNLQDKHGAPDQNKAPIVPSPFSGDAWDSIDYEER